MLTLEERDEVYVYIYIYWCRIVFFHLSPQEGRQYLANEMSRFLGREGARVRPWSRMKKKKERGTGGGGGEGGEDGPIAIVIVYYKACGISVGLCCSCRFVRRWRAWFISRDLETNEPLWRTIVPLRTGGGPNRREESNGRAGKKK